MIEAGEEILADYDRKDVGTVVNTVRSLKKKTIGIKTKYVRGYWEWISDRFGEDYANAQKRVNPSWLMNYTN